MPNPNFKITKISNKINKKNSRKSNSFGARLSLHAKPTISTYIEYGTPKYDYDFRSKNYGFNVLIYKKGIVIENLGGLQKKTIGSESTIFSKYISEVSNFRELFTIIDSVKEIAKNHKKNRLICRTWIFAEHPLLAEKLGLKLTNPLSVKKFKKIIEEQNIKRITNFTFAPKNKIKLEFITKQDKLDFKLIDKNVVPEYEAYIN